jgi:hypothetical protein
LVPVGVSDSYRRRFVFLENRDQVPKPNSWFIFVTLRKPPPPLCKRSGFLSALPLLCIFNCPMLDCESAVLTYVFKNLSIPDF